MPMGVGDIDVNAAPGWLKGLEHGNEITRGAIENQINNIKRKYADVTVPAEAASKLAYANLMGPQFLAKMLGNPDIVANLEQNQIGTALDRVYKAGVSQSNANSAFSQYQPSQTQQQPQNPFMQLLSSMKNGIGNVFGYGQQQQQPQQPQQPQQQFANNNVPQQQYRPVNEPYSPIGLDRSPPLDETGHIPIVNPPGYKPPKTYFEKAGEAAGLKKEGEEAGGIRAKAIDELDKEFEQTVNAETPIKSLMQISQSPVFMNMRSKVPFFQDKQLNVLKKIGTPEQQKMIGRFINSAQNAVANTVSGFGGRALVREFDIGEKMKVSEDDTWNVMIGKLGSAATLNEVKKQLTRTASDIMQDEHIGRGKAIEKALGSIDKDAIRESIDKSLSPKPTDDDIRYMSSKYGKSENEIRKLLKQKGLL